MRRVKRFFKASYRAWERFNDDDGPLMAAAVSYYVGLSLFPLLLVLIAGLGMFFRYTHMGQDAEAQVLRAVSSQLSPTLAEQVKSSLGQVRDRSTVNGPIGLLSVLIAALAAFAQFERAFDRIWAIPRKEPLGGFLHSVIEILRNRGVAFLSLLLLGLFIIVIFISGIALSGVQSKTEAYLPASDWLWTAAQLGTSLLLNTMLFTLVFRWLPKETVQWSFAVRGAVFTAVLWEIGRQILGSFLIGTQYGSAYGVVGSFIGVLLWCYYAVTVIFLGAEYVQAYAEQRTADEVAALEHGMPDEDAPDITA